MNDSNDFPANLREARERKKYLKGHKESIVDLLQETLKRKPDIKDPIEVFSGVGEISLVYLLTAGLDGNFKDYVAKFELQDDNRYRAEKGALNRLAELAVPRSVLKAFAYKDADPSSGNPALIIFEAAHSFSRSGRIVEFQQLLQDQLESNLDNCLYALTLLNKELLDLHNSHPGSFETKMKNGKAMTWKHFFSFKLDELYDSANFAYAPIQWKKDPSASIIIHKTRLPNPIAALEDRLNALTGKLRLSLIHGDLNSTNVLFTLDRFRAPDLPILIDVSHAATYKPTAVDYARLEVDLWGQVFPEIAGQNWQTLLGQMRSLLEDGEAQLTPGWTERGAVSFFSLIRCWRKFAYTALSEHKVYVPDDYLHCLYFGHMKKLSYGPDGPELRLLSEPMQQTHLGIHLFGASIAVNTLNRIQKGAYTATAEQQLSNFLEEKQQLSRIAVSPSDRNDNLTTSEPRELVIVELDDRAYLAFPQETESQIAVLRFNHLNYPTDSGLRFSGERFRQYRNRVMELRQMKNLTIHERAELTINAKHIDAMQFHLTMLAEGFKFILFHKLSYRLYENSVAAEAIRNFVIIMSPSSMPAGFCQYKLFHDKLEPRLNSAFVVANGLSEAVGSRQITEDILQGWGCKLGKIGDFASLERATHGLPAVLLAIESMRRTDSQKLSDVGLDDLLDLAQWSVW